MTSAPASTELQLQVGADQYRELGRGFAGALPVTTWLLVCVSPLRDVPLRGVWPVVGVAVALVFILVLPWLVPFLVLRARQPRGARLTWDDQGVSLWDGPWQSVILPWTEVVAGHAEWQAYRRLRPSYGALQLRHRHGGAAITIWTGLPGPGPRLRQCVADLGPLLAELGRRGISSDSGVDWALAFDLDRPLRTTLKSVGRFGYTLAVLAPLVLAFLPVAGLVLAAGAAALLALRAWPALAELTALYSRKPAPSGPEAQCLRWRRRAVWVEVLVRVGLVAMVVMTTAIAWVWLRT